MNDRRERIARGLGIAAHYAAHGGAPFLPIFERLEREHAAIGAIESALDRARRIAAARK